MSRPALSLVIPCYNEAPGLPMLVDRVREALGRRGDVEVILVDNGSTDATPDVLPGLIAAASGDALTLRAVRVPVNQGYGHGILTGLRAAEGEALGWTHADLQTDPADALTALDLMAAAPEPARAFVKGRRFGRPLGDRVFTWGMAAFETALLRTPMWDINAQPTVFSRAFFATWDDPPGDFSLDLYAYWRAAQDGLTIVRFPVHFGPRVFGDSRWNTSMAARGRFIRRTVDFSLALARRRR